MCADDAHLDGVDLQALAQRVGTPLHVYSASAIRQRIQALQTALQGLDTLVCYAVKANANLAILEIMAEAGLGADIVSAGELQRSLRAGIPASRIVNPDVDPLTQAKISTGKSENKFGVGIDEARAWFADSARQTHVRLDGLHVHIGSQMLDVDPIRLALQRVASFWRELASAGHLIHSIDVGGGLGACYRDARDQPVPIGDYADVIRKALRGFGGRILLEPGRWLVAEGGTLLTRVLRVKQGRQRQFLVVDAGMLDRGRYAVVRRRQTFQEMIAGERPARDWDSA